MMMIIIDDTNDSHLLGGRRGGDGVQSILRTCFNIFANAHESKSLDFSDALLSYVIAKMLKEVRKTDCIGGDARCNRFCELVLTFLQTVLQANRWITPMISMHDSFQK